MNHESVSVPSAEKFRRALVLIEEELSPAQRSLLLAHLRAPKQTMAVADLARLQGYRDERTVEVQYGKIGQLIQAALKLPEVPKPSSLLVAWIPPGAKGNHEWLWALHPELIQALQQLAWK